MTFLMQIIPLSFIFMIFFFSIQRKQLLSALLILEMIMIIIIFTLTTMMSKTMSESFYIMILLTFAATEASIGLATLVMMMRSYGSDSLNFTTNFKC